MSKRNHVQNTCKVCGKIFEVVASQAKSIVNCSRPYSSKYISLTRKGKPHPWAYKTGLKLKGRPRPWMKERLDFKLKMRELALKQGLGNKPGATLSLAHREAIRKSQLGHSRCGWKLSRATREKMSLGKRGDKTNFWKGGICPVNAAIRSSFAYKEWRRAVFERDNYTCVNCEHRGGRLHADHIKEFAKFPDLRLDVANGRTLCVPCHKLTPSYLNGAFAKKSA